MTARAIARLGKAYGDIAFYDRASDKLEEYAKKYAGEKDAYDAMSDAVFYRKGIGDDAKAIADTKYFIKTFGTKKPAGRRERELLADLDLREAAATTTRSIKHLRDVHPRSSARAAARTGS